MGKRKQNFNAKKSHNASRRSNWFTSFCKSNTGKKILITAGVGIVAYGAKQGISYYMDGRKKKRTLERQIELENLRQKHRLEAIKERQNNVGEENDNVAEGEYTPFPSENAAELVRRPIDPSARIRLYQHTFVQRRDIVLFYGQPGTMKSFVSLQNMTAITTGKSNGLFKCEDGVLCPQQGIYYDVEATKTEWHEKYGDFPGLENTEVIHFRELKKGLNPDALLRDVEYRVRHTPSDILILIDPIDGLVPNLKKNEIKGFVSRLSHLQEERLKLGYNVTFFLVSHAVKSPKGKLLEDNAGYAAWNDCVKTIASLRPYSNKYTLLVFDKTKNGKEINRGSIFVLRRVEVPFTHMELDEEKTQEYRLTGAIAGAEGITLNRMPKRTGKIAQVPPEVKRQIQELRDEQGYTVPKIIVELELDERFGLLPAEIGRIIGDVREAKGLSRPNKRKRR